MKHPNVNRGTVPDSARPRGPNRVRNGGRVLVRGAALLIALGMGPLIEVRGDLRETPDVADEGSQVADRLLQRAGNALGGGERLRAIDRLHITTVEWRRRRPDATRHRTYKLWLPDRFQSHVEGIVTHTLNGGRLTFDRAVPPDARRSAEEAVPAMFRRVALAFLLRAPGLSSPRLHGEATIAGLRGALVEFAAAEGRSLKLLLAPTSAHPLALVYSVRVAGSTEQFPDRVWRLEDYRVVDGVRFPFRLTVVHPENELITEVKRIEVNPPFTPADFPRNDLISP